MEGMREREAICVGGPSLGSKGGNPHRRTLAQLLRFGMKVAQEGI
jgi:hypothetical protein